MISAAERENQATACLQAAERYQPALLALARGLAGSREEGMELFQQAVMNCHDAIQTGGFQGDHYQFYMRRAIKNLHYRTEKQQQRRVTLNIQEPTLLVEELPGEWELHADSQHLHLALHEPSADFEAEQTHLAEQIRSEVQQRFGFADRVAWRLSLDGLNCRQIAEHIGTKDQSWVNRRLKRMKDYLREVFQPAFDNLGE